MQLDMVNLGPLSNVSQRMGDWPVVLVELNWHAIISAVTFPAIAMGVSQNRRLLKMTLDETGRVAESILMEAIVKLASEPEK